MVKKIVNNFNQKIPFHGIFKILWMKTIFFLYMLIHVNSRKCGQNQPKEVEEGVCHIKTSQKATK